MKAISTFDARDDHGEMTKGHGYKEDDGIPVELKSSKAIAVTLNRSETVNFEH